MDSFHQREKILLIIVGSFLLVIVFMGSYSFYINAQLREKQTLKRAKLQNTKYITPTTKPIAKVDPGTSMIFKGQPISEDKLIMVVGEENIFYKDYAIEILNTAQGKEVTDDMKKQALQKLVNDSILIQYAIGKGYISLPDMTLYNSPNKQYPQRLDLVMRCEEKLTENEFRKITGNAMKISFFNIISKDVTLEEGKEIIRKKIIDTYTQVKEGRKTTEEAIGEFVKSPEFSKMTKLDIVPTPFEFDSVANKKITESENFDKLIWQTPAKSSTPIYHSTETGDKDAYMFGYIKSTTLGYTSMRDFYDENQGEYKIMIK